ncbi:MAG: hypothetical protein HYT80_07690 [Euryarchaeota archaeon]|nr:hypothetical protein [Euryarchaeota archaeon]
MIATRLVTLGLVVLLIASVSALAWATKTTLALSEEQGEIAVEPDRTHYENGEAVLIRVRNIGENTLVGAPRVLVLNSNGGVQQSFAFGQFRLELEPQESVWVEWKTAPNVPQPCMYGKADSSGAPEGASYPCPMGGVASGPGIDDGMRCYPCPPYYQGLQGEFVIVGIFGSFADAAVITLA